ncbi:MAG: hypothetical protein ACK5IP_15765 [Paracoccus sp. (in: a-proteobacteria)]
MRRDLKGNQVKLPHIKTIRKLTGATYNYLAIPGKKMVKLPDGPRDTPEFLAAQP